MNTIAAFIQKIILDLNLGQLKPTVQKALELKIGTLVDEQIENALQATLTKDDWTVFDEYRKQHPDASEEEAFDAMLKSREELQNALSGALFLSYKDVMMRQEALHRAEEEQVTDQAEHGEAAV